MKHPLEIENEEIQKRLEATYSEIADVECEIARYDIMEMADSVMKNTNALYAQSYFTNTILANKQTFNDMMKWGNNK